MNSRRFGKRSLDAVLLRFIVILVTFLTLSMPSHLKAAEGAGTVRCATLKNGLRVVILRNPLAPVVTTRLTYMVGSNESPPGFPGTAHALEHMMFRGSRNLSAEQLAGLTASMGGRSNAYTQQTITQYFFTVPAEQLEAALHIEAIRMQEIVDSPGLWAKERGAIEQEVARDHSNPMYVFYTRLLAHLFAGTPYAHDALGTRSSFQRTTAALLRRFHDIWYVPNNAVLVVAGDLDPGHTLTVIRRLFEAIPSRPLPPRPPVKLRPLHPGKIQLASDLSYGLAVVAYRLPGYSSPDFPAARILADVLNSRRGKIYGLGAHGKALFAEFNSSIFRDVGMGYAVAGFPKGDRGEAHVTALGGVIAQYLKNGIPADLVAASKRREMAASEFRKNSIEGLSAQWSEALTLEGRHSPDDAVAAIDRVTVADVNRVLRKYLRNADSIVGLLIPQKSGKPTPAKGFHRAESLVPSQSKPVVLPPWAAKAASLPATPASRVNPISLTLHNGLRLIVQPETISRTITIYGGVKNRPELQEPAGEEGITEVLEGMFAYGTTHLDRLNFRKAVDDIAADLEVGRRFSLQVLADHFDRGVELLADNLLHPALPSSAFKIVQRETAARIAGRMESPSYLAKRALLVRLYPSDDPFQREATPGTIGSLTLDKLRAYYRRIFRPDLTTVVVIGDVTPEKAQETVLKYFGDWKAIGPKPQTDLPPVPLNKPAAAVVPDVSRVQDRVSLLETLGITRSHPDYYPLNLGLHVLSGGFYATRLYRDLRKRTGLVYTVQAFLQAHKTRSLFGVVYGCDPANVFKARSLVLNDLREMQQAPVLPAELRRARALLVRQIALSESSVEGIGDTLLTLSLEDLPLDEPVFSGKRYLKISAEQIRTAFAKWIRPDDFVQIVRGPVPH